MDIQIKVMGHDLFRRLEQIITTDAALFPNMMNKTPVTWQLTEILAGANDPEQLLCSPEHPCVLVVEAHDSVDIEHIRAMEEQMYIYIRRYPDLPMVICPIIMVFQPPAILMGSADFPDIVSDWLLFPVAISDLALRVFWSLKRRGLLKVERKAGVQNERILSDREVQILRLADLGLKNSDLAKKVFLSETTVKWHLRNIYTKFNVRNRTSAIARARELGLL